MLLHIIESSLPLNSALFQQFNMFIPPALILNKNPFWKCQRISAATTFQLVFFFNLSLEKFSKIHKSRKSIMNSCIYQSRSNDNQHSFILISFLPHPLIFLYIALIYFLNINSTALAYPIKITIPYYQLLSSPCSVSPKYLWFF